MINKEQYVQSKLSDWVIPITLLSNHNIIYNRFIMFQH
jgi:hypothetical protein